MDELMERKWSHMSPLQSNTPSSSSSSSSRESTRPLKQVASEKAVECILAIHGLAAAVGKSCHPEEITTMNKELCAKASTLSNIKDEMEQMPVVISAMDSNLDAALESAKLLPEVNDLLSKPLYPSH